MRNSDKIKSYVRSKSSLLVIPLNPVMKPKKSERPESSGGYHRNCHMAYAPPVTRIPKRFSSPEPGKKDRKYPQKNSRHNANTINSRENTASKKSVNEPDKEIISIFEHSRKPRIAECLVDNVYYSKPLIQEDINMQTPKTTNPIKKIYFNLPADSQDYKSEEEYEANHARMDWNNYHRLSVIHQFMDDLESSYPSLCTTGVIGSSVEGRELKILKVSNSDASNSSVWIDAGIHAREWIAPAVNTYLANYITKNFDKLPTSITNKDWYFLPVINPDGYEYSHTHERLWRKNRAVIHGECLGVDLNRNFSFGWGGKGSSDQPTNGFYRGSQPFSEPESSAMRDILTSSGINFKVYITLHSFGQVIIFPYACSSELAPDYVRLLEGATVMSKAIYNTNGNIYKVGVSRDVMYGAAGTSNDFAHGVVGIPYCYLIELRSKKHKFKLPKEEIEETGAEILNCIKALMEFVDSYPLEPEPDDENLEEFHRVARAQESLKKPLEVIRKDYVSRKKASEGNDQGDRRNAYSQEDDSLLNSSSSEITFRHHTHRNRMFIDAKDCNMDMELDVEQVESRTGWHFEEDWMSSDSFDYRSDSLLQTSDPNTVIIKPQKNTTKVAPHERPPQVWELRFSQEGQRHFVKTLDTLGAINIWKEERSTMDIMIEGPRTAQVAGMLTEREIPYTVAVPDINPLLDREQGSAGTQRSFRRSSIVYRGKHQSSARKMDWKSYHRLDTIYDFLHTLAAEYPYLCSVQVIGKSVEGRDMKILKISNGNENNSGVWLDGAIHPREWISPAVVTYIADRIVRHFDQMPESVTNKDWYILPVMNPDGYEYTHTHDRMWRKNRARYGECVGVDLNRNFSYGFGEKGDEGSSDDPGNIFYRGPKAFSEPETAAVRRAVLEAPTTFKVFLSFHSYGEVIIFPWGYTAEPCPDYVELLEGGTAMAKAIFKTNGHTYKVGSTKDLMYYAAGTSIDWSYAVTNIPYSYMVELRGKTHRFLLPKEEIISTATEVFNGVVRLLEFVDRRCSGADSCACPKI